MNRFHISFITEKCFQQTKGQFCLEKFFRRNLNETISLSKIDVILKLMAILANKIALFRFSQKLFVRGNWPYESAKKNLNNFHKYRWIKSKWFLFEDNTKQLLSSKILKLGKSYFVFMPLITWSSRKKFPLLYIISKQKSVLIFGTSK